MEFQGYLRPDGRLGIRNKVLIVALDECCHGFARRIAGNDDDVVLLINHYTCMLGGNEETFNQMVAACYNPNVSGILVIAMGCGSIMIEHFVNHAAPCGKPIETLACIDEGGSRKAIACGKEKLNHLLAHKDTVPRKKGTMADLFIGIKCGGSDTSSGIASNPSVGKAADKIIAQGGSAVAGEMIELVGCDNQLRRRAVTEAVGDRLVAEVQKELSRWSVEGTQVESMSIGNCVGGLTTIEEKSLGALHKTGTAPIQDFLGINAQQVDRPHTPGFYLSDVSHLCGGAGTNFVALGVQAVLWTSGGAGFDCELCPVIKVSGNSAVFNEDMDINATGIMDGSATVDTVSDAILERLESVCQGHPTATEGYGSTFLTIYQKDVRVESLLHLPCAHKEKGQVD